MRNKIIEAAIDAVVNESEYSPDFKAAFKKYVKNKFDDNATESASPTYSKLCSRRSSEVDVDNVETHTHKSSANNVAHHVARDTCVATNNYFAASLCFSVALHESSVSCCKLNDVKRVESVARVSADSTADA